MTPRRLASYVLPLAVVAVLAGCGSSGGTTASPASASPSPATSAPASAAPAEAAVITIAGFKYTVPASVTAGSKLTVKNADSQSHTVTLKGGAKVVVPGNGTAELTAPATVGTYPITCDFHGNMKADLVVT